MYLRLVFKKVLIPRIRHKTSYKRWKMCISKGSYHLKIRELINVFHNFSQKKCTKSDNLADAVPENNPLWQPGYAY